MGKTKKTKKEKVKLDLEALENFLCPNCRTQLDYAEPFCCKCGYNTWTEKFHNKKDKEAMSKILNKPW